MNYYKCIRIWARHIPGDIIEEAEYNRIPKEIQDKCFKLHQESAPVPRPKKNTHINPMIEAKPAGYSLKTASTAKKQPNDELT